MSDKPKVYQGVRVKATVKELLQKRRALQAAIKTTTNGPHINVITIDRAVALSFIPQSVAMQDVCSPSFSAFHFDVCPGNSLPDSSNSQPRQYIDNVCNIPVESTAFDNQQLINMMLSEFQNFSNNPLPPPSSAQHWPHGHFPSNNDYYTQGMAPSSPADSLSLPSPVDYNSYSPPQSYSSSSSCYGSPTRMESSYGLVPDCYHYQNCSPQQCYCASHWSGPQDCLTNLEYPPYGTPDFTYTSAMEESYYRRDMSTSEMCYL
ncbi:hypothetical protein AGOR_G00124010 [Albula goreensis]|uniref:OCA domain-containing protein n=1 Tax=Albula goreensis TaxID=1534307 RepID=A0A8T3DB12_9TELE|nr:hypothetical protein AGOR_G00124010 [Albula goreensis]